MKLISFDESEWKIEKIDSLVREGVFSSRAEAYRSGVLLMCVMNEAQKLAKLDKLDSDLFGKEVRLCLKTLQNKNYQIVAEKLKEIADTLQLRGLLSPLIDTEADRDSFETISSSMKKYADVVSKFDAHDENTQARIMEDLKRDLSAIVYYLEQQESKVMETSRKFVTKSESKKQVVYKSRIFVRKMPKSENIVREYSVENFARYISKSEIMEEI